MPRLRKETKKTTISCTPCRNKKRKCDGNLPCHGCQSKGIECHYVDVDRRRKRPQASYVEALEAANVKNNQLLDSLRENISDHQALIKLLSDSFENSPATESDNSQPLQAETSSTSITNTGEVSEASAVETDKKFDHLLVSKKNGATPMVLGPTSVYNDDMIIDTSQEHKSQSDVPKERFQQEQEDLTSEQMKELIQYRARHGYQSTYKLFYFKPMETCQYPLFRQCISLFFKWMYSSSFLFIHRESFLYFFLNNETNCEFVSLELIYAISALGARVSSDNGIKNQADDFYNLAKKKILGTGDERYFIRDSSICKLQTLLCLALYDLGRGELTSCWLLSGLAFRMGYDFGFELDPKNWNVGNPIPAASTNAGSVNASTTSLTQLAQNAKPNLSKREKLYRNYPFDIRQLRSRIYWGSCVADRLISLVMGRTSTLRLAGVTVPDSQDIGDMTGLEDFIFYDDWSGVCRAYHCLKAAAELLSVSDDILKKVFGSQIKQGTTRLQVLSDFNLKLLHWKGSLGPELFWNKSILRKTARNELYMGPRYMFFIIMLSVNRPFVSMAALGSSKSIDIDNAKMPIEICDDVIDDLEIVVRALSNPEQDHKVFCPHISSVYSVILAISVLLWRFKISKDRSSKQAIANKLDLFFNFLERCQEVWPLAKRPVLIFRRRINELWLDPKDIATEYNSPVPTNLETFPTAAHSGPEVDINHFMFPTVDYGGYSDPNSAIYDTFSRSLRNNHEIQNGFNDLASYNNIEDVFQSIFEEPSNQQIFTRLDLADALWDEALYEKNN